MITNTVNSMFYYGVRSCIGNPSEDTEYMGSSKYLKKAIADFGSNSFVKVVVEEFSTRAKANKMEEDFLTSIDARNHAQFYNRTNGDKDFTTYGMTPTEATKGIISEKCKLRWTPDVKAAHSKAIKKAWADGKMATSVLLRTGITREGTNSCLKGESRTDAQKLGTLRKVEATTGVPRPDFKGVLAGDLNPFYGKTHTEEFKHKMRVRLFNEEGTNTANTTGYTSISAVGASFRVVISRMSVGTFKTLKEAIVARDSARVEILKVGFDGFKKYLRRTRTCPHCGTTGTTQSIDRKHFDNCKHKPQEVM